MENKKLVIKRINITIIILSVVMVIALVGGLMVLNVIPNPFREEIVFKNKNIIIGKNDSMQLELKKSAVNVHYKSSDSSIVSVDEETGYITGLNEGKVTITAYLYGQEDIYGECIVEVLDEAYVPAGTKTVYIKTIKFNSTSVSLYVGDTKTISFTKTPSNANEKVTWSTSNAKVATVDNNGKITAKEVGTAIIKVKSTKGKTANCTVTVLNKPIDNNIWGYTDSKVVNPVRVDINFFKDLAKKGIGKVSNNTYTYSKYTYDISKSTLSYNGRKSLIRIYYPKNVDLSNVNTFTFFGGTTEQNFKGMFSAVDKDTSKIKSGGIIILVSSPGTYNYQDGLNATSFVKAITKQKAGKKNNVGGYSLGGPAAGKAMINGTYNNLFLLHTKIELKDAEKLKNKTIYVYSPKGDKLKGDTNTTLTSLKNKGARKNITLVTNDSLMIKTFGSYFIIVNPGNAQGAGHGYVNFVNGNLFAFACKD